MNLTTDRHEASRGFFATAELLVLLRFAFNCIAVKSLHSSYLVTLSVSVVFIFSDHYVVNASLLRSLFRLSVCKARMLRINRLFGIN